MQVQELQRERRVERRRTSSQVFNLLEYPRKALQNLEVFSFIFLSDVWVSKAPLPFCTIPFYIYQKSIHFVLKSVIHVCGHYSGQNEGYNAQSGG